MKKALQIGLFETSVSLPDGAAVRGRFEAQSCRSSDDFAQSFVLDRGGDASALLERRFRGLERRLESVFRRFHGGLRQGSGGEFDPVDAQPRRDLRAAARELEGPD